MDEISVLTFTNALLLLILIHPTLLTYMLFHFLIYLTDEIFTGNSSNEANSGIVSLNPVMSQQLSEYTDSLSVVVASNLPIVVVFIIAC